MYFSQVVIVVIENTMGYMAEGDEMPNVPVNYRPKRTEFYHLGKGKP